MPWPLSQDYNEAIQDPATAFADAELRQGSPVLNALGLPMPRSGNFADVYQFQASGQAWAVKCFTREVLGLQERYAAISKHMQQARLPFTVDFQYQEKGIRIRGQWYPILKMHWVEGLLLNEFVRESLEKPGQLEALSKIWVRMGQRLREAQIAHADLQHGNVILVPGSKATSLAVKLIDYDGMYVPALAERPSGEVGHPSYQHPQRLQKRIYSAEVDRVPLLAVACALRCLLVAGKPLWDKYDNGDNLLFKEHDLAQPEKSDLLKEMWSIRDATAHDLVGHLVLGLYVPLHQAPWLPDVLRDDVATPLHPAQESHVTKLLGGESKSAALPTTVSLSASSARPTAVVARAGTQTEPAAPAWTELPAQPLITTRPGSRYARKSRRPLVVLGIAGLILGMAGGIGGGFFLLNRGSGDHGDPAAIRNTDPQPGAKNPSNLSDADNKVVLPAVEGRLTRLDRKDFLLADRVVATHFLPLKAGKLYKLVLTSPDFAPRMLVEIASGSMYQAGEYDSVSQQCHVLVRPGETRPYAVHVSSMGRTPFGKYTLQTTSPSSTEASMAEPVMLQGPFDSAGRMAEQFGRFFALSRPRLSDRDIQFARDIARAWEASGEGRVIYDKFSQAFASSPNPKVVQAGADFASRAADIESRTLQEWKDRLTADDAMDNLWRGAVRKTYPLDVEPGKAYRIDLLARGVNAGLRLEGESLRMFAFRPSPMSSLQLFYRPRTRQRVEIVVLGLPVNGFGDFVLRASLADPRTDMQAILASEMQYAGFRPLPERERIFNDLHAFVTLRHAAFTSMDLEWLRSHAGRLEMMNPFLAAKLFDFVGNLFSHATETALAEDGTFFANAARRLRLVGRPLNVQGDTADGRFIDLANFRGKVVLVDFIDETRPVPPHELARLKKLYQSHARDGFEILTVGLRGAGPALQQWQKKERIPWKCLSGKTPTRDLEQEYGITQLPYRFLIGMDGKVQSLNPRGDMKLALAKLLPSTIGTVPNPSGRWKDLVLSGARDMGDFLRITGNQFIETKKRFAEPIEVRAEVRTSVQNIRLHAMHGSRVILNWELNPAEIVVNHADGPPRRESGSPARGPFQPLQPDRWYRIRWQIARHGMRVFIDDRVVYEDNQLNRFQIAAPAGVHTFPTGGSVVDVKSLEVVPLTELAVEPPPETEVAAAVKKLRATYLAEFTSSRPEERRRLIQNLFDLEIKAKDAVRRYACLKAGMTQAVEIFDFDLAFQAAERMSQAFQGPPLWSYSQALETAYRVSKTPWENARLAHAIFRALDMTTRQCEFTAADQVIGVAKKLARKTKDGFLQKEVQRAAKSLEQLKADYARTAEARKTLHANAADTKANLALGQFYCFTVGDWNRGLPYLAAGNNPLAEVARRDLAIVGTPRNEFDLARRWWDLADTEGVESLRERAVFWFRQIGRDRFALTPDQQEKMDACLFKALQRPAAVNGLDVPKEISLNLQAVQGKIGPLFDLHKSWGFAVQIQPQGVVNQLQTIFIWGDDRRDQDPICLQQAGRRLDLILCDNMAGKNRRFLLAKDLNFGTWYKLAVAFDADTRLCQIFVNGQMVRIEQLDFNPSADRPMPIWLGGAGPRSQRFKGKVKELWLSNL
jgi:hypothetical protein